MSKLQALRNAANKASGFNANQPRDENGRWTSVAKGLAVMGVEKGIIAGAAFAGQHFGGEAGAIAATIGARAAIVVTKNVIQSQAAKEKADAFEQFEAQSMTDVIGREISRTVGDVVGDLTGLGGLTGRGVRMGAGMAVAAVSAPKLSAAARSLKSKMQTEQTTLRPRTT